MDIRTITACIGAQNNVDNIGHVVHKVKKEESNANGRSGFGRNGSVMLRNNHLTTVETFVAVRRRISFPVLKKTANVDSSIPPSIREIQKKNHERGHFR